MNDYTLTIKSHERKGVLYDITDVITDHGANISYVHLFVEKNNIGSGTSKREEIKTLIKHLRTLNPNIDDNIFRSLKNANIDALLGYRQNGELHSFLDDYENKIGE